MSIPDADYIRDTEQNGIYSPNPVKCPVCGKHCETIYLDINGDATGCEHCVKAKDAYLWAEEDL